MSFANSPLANKMLVMMAQFEYIVYPLLFYLCLNTNSKCRPRSTVWFEVTFTQSHKGCTVFAHKDDRVGKIGVCQKVYMYVKYLVAICISTYAKVVPTLIHEHIMMYRGAQQIIIGDISMKFKYSSPLGVGVCST